MGEFLTLEELAIIRDADAALAEIITLLPGQLDEEEGSDE